MVDGNLAPAKTKQRAQFLLLYNFSVFFLYCIVLSRTIFERPHHILTFSPGISIYAAGAYSSSGGSLAAWLGLIFKLFHPISSVRISLYYCIR